MPEDLFKDRAALASLCRHHRIRRLSLFGSFLKGTARPDSDVDLLIEFAPGARPSLFELMDIERALSALLDGRSMDVRTAEDLSRYFREEVLREAKVQYVRMTECGSSISLRLALPRLACRERVGVRGPFASA